jgi:hypothetical protein
MKREKTGGRQAGTPNRTTAELRERIRDLIDTKWETLMLDFDTLEPKERWQVAKDLMAYATPKMQAVRAEIDYTLPPHEMQLRQIDERELIAALLRGGVLLGLPLDAEAVEDVETELLTTNN